MPKRFPVKVLGDFTKANGLQGAVLIAYDGGTTHFVTYGTTIERCARAAEIGNKVKELMGHDNLFAEPSRVMALKKRIKELEDQVNELSRKPV